MAASKKKPRYLPLFLSFILNPWLADFLKDGKILQILFIGALTWYLVTRQARKLKMISLIVAGYLIFSLKFVPETIFQFSPEELFTLNQRRSYYESSLEGRLMENKLWRWNRKFQSNFFHLLDANYYFFAAHPRERPGITETEKFFWVFLPFFFFGLISQIKSKENLAFKYFFGLTVLLSFFQNIDQLAFLVFPLIIFIIYEGFSFLNIN